MYLNGLGQIAAEDWKRSEEIRDRVHPDAFMMMPNHLHSIVVLADPAVDAPTCPRGYRALGTASGDDSNESPGESNAAKPSHGGRMTRWGNPNRTMTIPIYIGRRGRWDRSWSGSNPPDWGDRLQRDRFSES